MTDWMKVLYKSGDMIKVAQGNYSDNGSWVSITGDFTTVELDKELIVGIIKRHRK